MNSLQQIVTELQEQKHFGEKVLITLLILLVAILANRLLAQVWKKAFKRELVIRPLRRATRFILFLLGGAGIIFVWSEATNTLVLLFTLFLVLIGLALKDLVMNFAGYLYIHVRCPFRIGDRIEINGQRGEIYDITLFDFTLLEIGGRLRTENVSGRILHIPNRDVFTHVLANYNRAQPYLWSELTVPITFDSNLEKAEKIILDIATEHLKHVVRKSDSEDLDGLSGELEISDEQAAPTLTLDATGSGIDITLRFLTPYRETSSIRTKIWRQILLQFSCIEDIQYSPTALRIIQSKPDNRFQ